MEDLTTSGREMEILKVLWELGQGTVRDIYRRMCPKGELAFNTVQTLVRIMDDKGTIAILAGNQTAPNLQKRVQGAKTEAAKYPGIKIVAPATVADAKGLLKSAIRDDNPVMFIEHKMLYKEKGPVPEEEYLIPLGVADIKRPGKDVTLVTYSRMVLTSLEAANKLAGEGIDVEVIDLRTLKPLDIDTIVASVKKTGRLVGVSEGYENTNFINEVMVQVNDLAFDWLDAPMVRVAAANVPVPRAEVLEDQAIPNVGRIMAACRKVVS